MNADVSLAMELNIDREALSLGPFTWGPSTDDKVRRYTATVWRAWGLDPYMDSGSVKECGAHEK